MSSDKDLKRRYKKIFSKNPEKYYPIQVLREMGYKRYQCNKCKKFFWSSEKRNVCGDASCIGKYDFLNKKITDVKFSYKDVWFEFAKLFKKLGYTPIKRYPVVARWRDDTLYVKASIYDFQPLVTTGEIPPLAKKLVIPQPCLRFNDIDNVGITMSHMSAFVMIGQHAFLTKEEWSQQKLFKDICVWLFDVLKIPKNELIFHEDAWAGGGNLGPCIEYFSGGLELGNQVYMLYKMQGNKPIDLKLKVLDMGMGMERISWFTQDKNTIYDSTFPLVLKKLLKVTGYKINKTLLKQYIPYGALLNTDEISNLEESFKFISKELNISNNDLKLFLKKMSAIYSIAEHARTLLFAIADGSLPSNVGDAYNLRILFRRAQRLIEENKWRINLEDVCEWHALELKELFPDLLENISDVKKIIQVEDEKYQSSKEKTKVLIDKIIKNKTKLSNDDLIELYDSKGIHPKQLITAGLNIEIPKNFYELVSEKHSSLEKKRIKKPFYKIKNIPRTTKLFYKEDPMKFSAKVLETIPSNDATIVILDKTNFYAKSGGQDYDTGTINNKKVFKVEKQGDYILHFIHGKIKKGQLVTCEVNKKRRRQLTVHHTATHIVNGSARKILGNHIYQAGASKTVEKARLDITHYKTLTSNEIKKIEDYANKIVKENLKITTSFIERNKAEQKYGFRIYQGGYVPGKIIRIVDINNFDVEACGGTHLKTTSEAGKIKILKSSKIHDGIIRLEFVAGERAKEISVTANENSSFANQEELNIAMQIFKVPQNKLEKIIKRFTEETSKKIKYYNSIREQLNKKIINIKIPKVSDSKSAKELFELWKELDKKIKKEEDNLILNFKSQLKDKTIVKVNLSIDGMRKLANYFNKIILINNFNKFVFKGGESEFNTFKKQGAKGGGSLIKQGNFTGDFKKLKEIF